MSEEEKLAKVVEDQLDAYNSRDLDKFSSCYHPGVIVRPLQKDEVLIEGRENLKAWSN